MSSDIEKFKSINGASVSEVSVLFNCSSFEESTKMVNLLFSFVYASVVSYMASA